MLVIDPEFMQLLPMSTKEELETLEKSLLAEGCRDPLIVTSQGTVIDGMTRFVVCQKRGIPFETVVKDFPDRKAACLWILENQLGRRNLTDAQRISIADQYLRLGKFAQDVRTVAKIAAVSEGTVKNFKQADASPVKELGRMMKAGEVSIGAAAKVAELPTRKQERIIVRGASAVKAAAAKVRAKEPIAEPKESPLPESSAIDEAFTLCKQLMAAVHAIAGQPPDRKPMPCGLVIADELQDVEKYVSEIRRALRYGRPYAVCPYCQGHKKACEGCKGRRWVPEDAYKRAPSEMREAVKGTVIS